MITRVAGLSLRSCAAKSATGSSHLAPDCSVSGKCQTFRSSLPPLSRDPSPKTRHFSTLSISKEASYDSLLTRFERPETSLNLCHKVRTFKAFVPRQRSFMRQALDASELQLSTSSSSATLLEMKKMLRQKSVDFTESHACLIITLPRHAVAGSSDTMRHKTFSGKSLESSLDDSLIKIFVNKLTSRFICPEESVFGDWTNLRSFLVAWQKHKFAKKGETLEPLPPLGHSLNHDQVQKCLFNSSEFFHRFSSMTPWKFYKRTSKDLELRDAILKFCQSPYVFNFRDQEKNWNECCRFDDWRSSFFLKDCGNWKRIGLGFKVLTSVFLPRVYRVDPPPTQWAARNRWWVSILIDD